jgi:hypothetical protein
MKLSKIIIASILCVTFASANETLSKSMNIMQDGIEKVQFGFINNNEQMVKAGIKAIQKGNAMFSDEALIKASLPEDKKHMVNVASNASKRIHEDSKILELNLNEKAYLKAAESYSDILNACSRCHSIIRSW